MRLPLAALLGAALALRPRRQGTPPRNPAVVQTQIVLSVVGAVIMLVVGASLARAFGIVGAANLIRYRSKIDDPKDAVVMLCALAVGLASGVGLYALAVFSTVFLVAALWVIESFEQGHARSSILTIKAGKQTDELRDKIEADPAALQARPRAARILRRRALLRRRGADRCSSATGSPNAILRLDPEGHASVDWSEKKNKAK